MDGRLTRPRTGPSGHDASPSARVAHESADPLGRDNGLLHPRPERAELRAVGLDGSPLHFLVPRQPGIGPFVNPEPPSVQPARRRVPVLGKGRGVRKLLVDEPIDILGWRRQPGDRPLPQPGDRGEGSRVG